MINLFTKLDSKFFFFFFYSTVQMELNKCQKEGGGFKGTTVWRHVGESNGMIGING